MNWPAIVSSMVLACLIGFLAPLVALFVTCLAAMFGEEKTGARNFSHFLFFSGMIIFVGCMTTIVLNLKNIFIPPLSSSFSLQLLLSDKFLPTFFVLHCNLCWESILRPEIIPLSFGLGTQKNMSRKTGE